MYFLSDGLYETTSVTQWWPKLMIEVNITFNFSCSTFFLYSFNPSFKEFTLPGIQKNTSFSVFSEYLHTALAI
ncbi:MAG TPA: hypothetical protein DEQ74_02225 [Wolbachia sp.]|nr:hypothetical protein [Wolbachia sp.]